MELLQFSTAVFLGDMATPVSASLTLGQTANSIIIHNNQIIYCWASKNYFKLIKANT